MLDVVVLTYLNLNNSGCDTSYIRSNFKIHATAENPISGIAPSVVQENFALRTDVPFAAQGPGDSGVQVLFWGSIGLGRHDCKQQKNIFGQGKNRVEVWCPSPSKSERQTEFSQLSGILDEKWISSRLIHAQKTLGEICVFKYFIDHWLGRHNTGFKIACKLLDRFSPAQRNHHERPRIDMMYDVSDPDIFKFKYVRQRRPISNT